VSLIKPCTHHGPSHELHRDRCFADEQYIIVWAPIVWHVLLVCCARLFSNFLDLSVFTVNIRLLYSFLLFFFSTISIPTTAPIIQIVRELSLFELLNTPTAQGGQHTREDSKMQLPPLSVVSLWPTPNYKDPQDVRGSGLQIIAWIFCVMALISVGIRTFTRLRICKIFGVEDILLIPAVISATGCTLLTTIGVLHWGWNRHIWDVPNGMLVQSLKMTSELGIASILK